eukprot:COSAG02_NODE_11260_length_1758_cov_1.599759_1_plen_183_part_10
MTEAVGLAKEIEEREEQHEVEAERQRRPQWVKHVNAATGDVFYVHSKTKEVRFESDNEDDEEDQLSIEEQRRQDQRRQEKKAAKAKVRMARRRAAKNKDRRFDPNDRQRKPPTPNTLFRQAIQDERAASQRERLRTEATRGNRSVVDTGWKSGTLETLNRSLSVELPIVSKSAEKLSLVEQHN